MAGALVCANAITHQIDKTKIEDFKNIELNALPIYNGRCTKTKLITYGDKGYASLCGLNVPEDGGAECEYFTIISFHSLFVYEN